jgi:hypothetical protein
MSLFWANAVRRVKVVRRVKRSFMEADWWC